MVVVIYLLICLAPVAILWGLDRSVAILSGASERLRRSTSTDREAVLAGYGRDLRRLAAEHERIRGGDDPASSRRLRVLRLAYDDVLRSACRELDLDVPRIPMEPLDRVQTEADLVLHGMSW